jgi:hypothetical protein
VDTSVWSLALRREPRDLSAPETAIVAELTHLIKESRVRIIGLVRQELLSGIKTAGQFEKLRGILRGFPDTQISTSDYETAAKVGNTCRAKGFTVSLADMLICAVALAHEWSIFTTDSGFKNYAKVLPITLHIPRK